MPRYGRSPPPSPLLSDRSGRFESYPHLEGTLNYRSHWTPPVVHPVRIAPGAGEDRPAGSVERDCISTYPHALHHDPARYIGQRRERSPPSPPTPVKVYREPRPVGRDTEGRSALVVVLSPDGPAAEAVGDPACDDARAGVPAHVRRGPGGVQRRA